MRAPEFTKHINKSRIFENTSQLPPNVIELIKKIAQSTAAPEHKKAMIDSLITKYRDKQGVPEGFDELDAYIKDKQAVKPSGGAGIKRGSYGTGERKTSYSGKTVGLTPYGTGSAIPSNRDFGRPHSMPRAAPRGLDDYDANYRREVDEIQQGVAEGADDLDKQALDVADKLTTDKNLAKLNDMAHDSTIYRALERYFAKNNISTTIFNRVAAIVFKKLDKYGRRLSTDPRIPEQGVAEGSDDFEVRLDGKTVPGPFNDFDHARNKASKLISYQKGEVAEVYVNGKLKMRLKLNTPHQHFDEHTAA